MSADVPHLSADVAPDGYPDCAGGRRLHKSSTSESGYKGVSIRRDQGAPSYVAREGAKNLGSFASRIEAATAVAAPMRAVKGGTAFRRALRRVRIGGYVLAWVSACRRSR